MTSVYSLDTAIDSFFKSATTATRQQCDDFVLAQGFPSIQPVPIQGTFSYTVAAGPDKIFQFRVLSSSIDTDLINLAADVHPQFVPHCKYHGIIEGSQPLCSYKMSKLPGTPYVIARDVTIPQPPDAVERQQRTVKDVAKFFAQAWNNSQQLDETARAALLSEFEAAFGRLSDSLPHSFAPVLNKVRQDLPSLFSGTELSFVLTHGDLCEMNLLIDDESGSLTGVVDWAEARILPFGFSLWGVENLLGYTDSKGWHYYDNAEQLRELFWQSFREETGGRVSQNTSQLIWTARMVGLFYRYGFVFEGRDILGVVEPESLSAKYLNAFCSLEGWAPVEWD